MRFSEAWLRDYVDPAIDTAVLVKQLTMAGLEVDSVTGVAGRFHRVVVCEIVSMTPHPQAERLRVCQVATGAGEPLQIVCGAPNARVGLRAPLAMEGAELPGGLRIGRTELRGIASFGMLCSSKELGLDDAASGLLELPPDAPVGADLREYLQLEDSVIEIDLTPNRADCLSVEGVAREVALLNDVEFRRPAQAAIDEGTAYVIPVSVERPEDCPRYLGRMIVGVDRTAATPLWMQERLRRSGLRCLNPLVDVTNYVLLELGQPLHAFDADKLAGGIRVRNAMAGEKISLLNDQEVALDRDVLVIADQRKALALAGIMGGKDSAVSETTADIFLECAFFAPESIAGKARRYGLATDSSHRFERGVDPQLQARAMERATGLILSIAGGKAGPVVEACSGEHLPKRDPILLRSERVARLLGVRIETPRVERILARLDLNPEPVPDGWKVVPPSYRFDLAIEVDVIEELGRIYGYDRLPRKHPTVPAAMRPASETVLSLDRAKDLLADRGYQEVITYSFVDEHTLELLDPGTPRLLLKNPISAEMAAMRTTLWSGLLDAALKNAYRQQNRIRLFEAGLRFTTHSDGVSQTKCLSGLVTGPVCDEQWAESPRMVDFFDLKADIEAIARLTGRADRLSFSPAAHPALHPGQAARISLSGLTVGWLGMLHPQLEKTVGFEQRIFLFELEQGPLLERDVPRFRAVSKFPRVRRDLALIVDEDVAVGRLIDCVKSASDDLLREVVVFDVYRGQGMESGKKSVALGLVWQDAVDTLTDARVEAAKAGVLERLAADFAAKLRD